MPCPHASGGEEGTGFERGPSRRSFLKSAVAIGGASALSACVQRHGMPDVPQGSGPEGLPARQHARNAFLPQDSHGNTVPPRHQLVLLLSYAGRGTPTDDHRASVEAALGTLERAFEWGNGGDPPRSRGGALTDGLFHLLGYSPSYFDRFEEPLPGSIDLQRPADTLEELDDDRAKADETPDAVLLLTSHYAQVLLAAEQALFGNLDELNGVPVEGSLAGVFERVDRRTGFKGVGKVAEELDVEGIPQASPAAMGIKSGFRGNQASEDSVTIGEGPFAEGATLHLSKLVFELEDWYETDDERQIHQMLSPDHTREQVGEIGEFLAADSGITRDLVDRTEEDARTKGVVGHTQKTARARNDDFEPLILRRSEAIHTNGGRPGMNFTSVQEGIADFVETRKAMDGADLEVEAENSGILEFIEVTNRANFLLPPRGKRALPTPRPG